MAELPAPDEPGEGQVIVRMRAAALNFADLLSAEGSYQDSQPPPYTPGIEGAGEVLAAGPGSGFAEGDRVVVCTPGTLAEAGVFPAAALTPLPEGIGWPEAAGLQVAYGTSHIALGHRAALAAGETLVVLGAGGGVGLTAVELGAALGARVIAVANGEAKQAAAKAAGAAEVLDGADPKALKAALRGLGGVDVVYDPVGGAPGLAAFGALNRGGRFLVIGFAAGEPPQLPLNHALVKNLAIHGVFWGGYLSLDPALLRRSTGELLGLVAGGKLRPHVGHRLPLDRIAEGFALLRDRRAVGKVVIEL
ncbi:NADPH:quinone oxidoreductase family protein [Paracoccus sp. S-4012]|uniref:NADPH:quinone oxidoreductase family protein n=1 Tax=Paracoccus sp. S-4012 TaxID=2665648 RepID=UPI00351B0C62